jgi:hypothetical protein
VTWNALFAAKHGQQDWRASSEWVAAEFQAHPGMQFVLVSGFVESSQPGRLDDPAYHDLLMAPQIVYPVPVSPILLPLRPNAEAARRLLESVAPAARQAERLVVVSCTMGPQYKSLFAESLRASGLRLTQEKSFGEVIGHVYERRE